ncbi:MAG: hypothetical protein HBSAPP03_24360 [Phycisphaerae bacterium]|nr:MAG: hypothetical protein HBSAPP03_24360 [Phycisphaerae bacterium]
MLALFMLVVLAACGDPTPAPPPPAGPRLVALSPAVAVMLRHLGREHEIVGRHASDLILDVAVPVCGDQHQIDYEALVAARPTHVFTQWGTRDLPERLRTLAAERGWVLHDCRLLTLDDVERETHELDVLLVGNADGSPEGYGAVQRLHAALRPRPELAGAGRVLLLAGVDPPAALGPGSFHHDMLVRLGATPAITTGGVWQELALEDVRRIAPDVIVLILPRSARTLPRGEREAPSLGKEAMARLGSLRALDTSAIRQGRVVLIDDPLAHLPATSLTDVAEQIAEGLARLIP